MFDLYLFEEYYPFLAFYVFIIGLCIGSFLNVVALRSLANEDFIFSRSKCPKCSHQLNWYNNIPLLSFIFQRGKCQFCNCKISIQYPIVEFLTGVLFLYTFLRFELSLKALIVLLFICFSVLLVTEDIKEKVIIDLHAYALIVLGIIYNALGLGTGFILSLAGAALGFLTLEALARSGYIFTKSKSRAFGEGDSIIAAGLGAFFGAKMFFTVFAVAILLEVLFAVPYMLYNKFKNKEYKNCFVLALATVFCCLLGILYYIDIYQYDFAWYILLPIIVVLLWCAIEILFSLKNKEKLEENSFIPFGPPLVISAIIMIFL